MTTRLTRDNLRKELEYINTNVLYEGQTQFLTAQGRNGYTGLDLCDHSGTIRTIATGTTRECLAVAYKWGVDTMATVKK